MVKLQWENSPIILSRNATGKLTLASGDLFFCFKARFFDRKTVRHVTGRRFSRLLLIVI